MVNFASTFVLTLASLVALTFAAPVQVCPLTLGIETTGGIFAKFIPRNTPLPCKKSQIFSTAVNNQPAVTVQVIKGDRQLLGSFELSGIKPAPRGIPQIEITVEIDARGMMKVGAQDKGTGKSKSITIRSQ